jgi:DNA-binding response OmpR family regulator
MPTLRQSILWSFAHKITWLYKGTRTNAMPSKLRALILSQDRAAVVPLETVFGISGVAFDVHTEEVAVTKALSQNHFDGIILDCDHEAGAQIIDQVKKSRSNKLTPLFTLTSSIDSVDQSRQNNVSLVLHKPLTVLRMTPHVKVAALDVTRASPLPTLSRRSSSSRCLPRWADVPSAHHQCES